VLNFSKHLKHFFFFLFLLQKKHLGRERRRWGGGRNRKGRKKEKNAVSPFVNGSRKKIFVLLSLSDKRFGVSRMQDFFKIIIKAK
jgi:hypothetical protein